MVLLSAVACSEVERNVLVGQEVRDDQSARRLNITDLDNFCVLVFFFFSSRRRHTRFKCDWSSDVCSSDLWSRIPQTFLANAQPTTMSDPLAKIKKKLQDEIDQLSHELSVELPKEIAVAPAHADLPENAEYKFAKERQGYVNLKITHLKNRMGDLSMLNLTNIPKDRSGYGSRLTVLDLQRDKKIDYTLVSSEEADAEKGLISTTSPIGNARLQ